MMSVTETRSKTRTGLRPATSVFPWPTLPVDQMFLQRLTGYLAECQARKTRYGLGEKAHVLTAYPPDYAEIDCSGWARAAIAYASEPSGVVILPDGSVNQHEWCEAQHLKVSSPDALTLHDGYLRIAFIVPTVQRLIGHVYLARNGMTYESHGGRGPDSRPVTSEIEGGRLCDMTTAVYVLGGPV